MTAAFLSPLFEALIPRRSQGMDGVDGKAKYSRRDFLASGITAGALIPASALLPAIALTAEPAAPDQHPAAQPSTMLTVDFRKLVSRADLDYTEPVKRSE